MRFPDLCLVSVALLGCKSETNLEQREARLSVAPHLLDHGDVAVGTVSEVLAAIEHLDGGAIQVFEVLVDGDMHTFEGQVPFTVDQDVIVGLPLVYSPSEPGWHHAVVTIVHDGEDSPAILDVRGHGLVPSATLSPQALDFGSVEAGSVEDLQVVVTNTGEVDLVLTAASSTHLSFSLEATLPMTLPQGTDVALVVQFAPADRQAAIGSLSLQVAGVPLPAVGVRGNDCEGGLPEAYDLDEDGVTECGGDCDDTNPSIRPGVPEEPDGIDQDCNGLIDEGTVLADDDGDGWCEDPTACTDGAMPGDCNDGSAPVNPGQAEVYGNGIDDDCDGVVDAGTSDADFDGYDPIVGGDCDDTDPSVYPGAPELPDGIDNDCDGGVDEGTNLYDDDGDGVSEAAGDCDDSDPTTWPGAPEVVDWRDNDCDMAVDEGTVNFDDDGDGYTEVGGDCDDGDPLASPALGTCP